MSSKTLDIVLRALGQDQVKSALEGVGDSAKKAGEDVSRAGADSARSFDGAIASAVSLTEKLEDVRNTALKVGAGGAALLALGNHLADAALKADGLGSTMAALLSGAGMEGATEKVKGLADEIAKVAGGDNNAIAVEISRAIATGRTKGLAQYGIVIGEVGQQAIKAAGEISEAAGKTEVSNQIMLAGAAAVAKLRENSSEAALSLSEMQHRMKKLSEGVGQGAANAKAAILGGILSPVMSVLEASPGLQTFAGGFIEIGGAGVTAGASMVAFASQALISAEKLGILGFAKAADVAASGRVATASGISAAAITAEGNAALVASGKLAALGRAKALAAGAAKVLGPIAAGVTLGVMGYDALRPEGNPSAGEIAGYYWNRLKGDNPNDAATRAMGFDPNTKGNNAEAESLRLSQASAARRGPRMAAAPTDEEGENGGSGALAAKGAAKAMQSASRAKEKLAKGMQRDAEKQQKDAERAAGKLEQLQNKSAGYVADVDRVRAEIAFNTQIDTLQLALDKAKDDGNAAQVKSLTFQIEAAKANQNLAVARAEAAKAEITDGARAVSIDEIADLRFADSMRRARVTAERAGLDAAPKGTSDASKINDAATRAMLALQRGSINLGFAALNPGGSARGGSSRPSSREVGRNQRQLPNGDVVTRLEVEVVSPYQGLASVGSVGGF
jgi:hypothetical protein